MDPARRARCEKAFKAFCKEYFPKRFYLEWSSDHHRAAELIEKAVRDGDLFAFAMPRGSGKTALAVAAVLWAVLCGHQRFVFVIAANAKKASRILASVKAELRGNLLLLEDFPEACYPIRKMEGISQRAHGQMCGGKPTHIGWKEDQLILPSIDGSKSASAIIYICGKDAAIRGEQFTTPNGEIVRPGFFLIDDPQTDKSAKNPKRVEADEKLLLGTILGSAGPGERLGAVMTCTVICENDLASRFLDKNRHPEWRGERAKMLRGWPKNFELWEEYRRLQTDSFKSGGDGHEATDYYAANRVKMDDGAEAAWPQRKTDRQLSAVQHAMDWYFSIGKYRFFAEMQNDPIEEDAENEKPITAEIIQSKANGLAKGLIPIDLPRLVSFIDVHKEFLFFGVAAVNDAFTGHIVDYGPYPGQGRDYYTKADLRETLAKSENTGKWEEAVYLGLESLTAIMLGKEFKSVTGVPMKMERCLIDARWGPGTAIVKKFCRETKFASIVTPSFGQYVGARSLPFSNYKKKPGDRLGFDWRMPNPPPGSVRQVLFDTNSWKTFLISRMAQPAGEGAWTIFGDREDHQLLIDHFLAERAEPVTGRGRTVLEFQNPGNKDNEAFDAFVGCCVAASICGSALKEMPADKSPKRKSVRFSDLEKKAWQKFAGGAGSV